MPDAAPIRLLIVAGASLFLRVVSAVVVMQPGYTDAYYYTDVASRLARGLGLTADFVWSPLELGPPPIVSHRFWMPLASTLQAAGIALFGGIAGDFRAGQLVMIAIAACVPAATYACARGIGASTRASLVAATLVGLGGLFAPAWVTMDGFAIAALLGALFFLAFGRAARGSVGAGAAAGVLVGLLYLTRAEAALFGIALLALAMRPRTRAAGLASATLAFVIGIAWLARDLAVGAPDGYLARTTLLAHYEDFFSLADPTTTVLNAPLGDVLGARGNALLNNAVTFAYAFGFVLVVPLVFGVRALWSHKDVRAWTGLVLLVFVAESLVWTLHSVRGSYFHSLAAFFAFGIAIAVAGGERLLASRPANVAALWTWGVLLLVAALSVGAVAQWDAAFNASARERAAALDGVPSGNFLALDAAAWRWLSGRTVLFTPSDGLAAAACVANVPEPHATSLVLEAAHFPAYDALYRGGPRPDWLGAPIERGTVRIFPIVAAAPCAIGFGR